MSDEDAFTVLTKITADINTIKEDGSSGWTDSLGSYVAPLHYSTPHHHEQQQQINSAMNDTPQVGSLVDLNQWPVLFSARFKPQSSFDFSMSRQHRLIEKLGNTILELITAGFISRMMFDYMSTVLYQTAEGEGNVNGKAKVVQFVEMKIDEECQQRRQLSKPKSVDDAIARVSALV
jgi:hypothetical protein